MHIVVISEFIPNMLHHLVIKDFIDQFEVKSFCWFLEPELIMQGTVKTLEFYTINLFQWICSKMNFD